MTFNFDMVSDRFSSESIKWHKYGSDILPLWVADMDFKSPNEVVDALQRRVAHGIYGYGVELPDLKKAIVERMWKKYQWSIVPEDIVFLPGVIRGFNLACQAFGKPGGNVLVQTPVYPPILSAPENAGLGRKDVGFRRSENGSYILDQNDFSGAIDERTCLFILCNPHNPIGHVFSRSELETMAEICLENEIVICSDEIHAELLYPGYEHHPIASLDNKIAQKTITLSAPSKTFNLAGLDFSFAVIQNGELRNSFIKSMKGLVGGVNILGQVAAMAAYEHGDPWLKALLNYLDENRHYLIEFLSKNLPKIHVTLPEATYLAWLDCREMKLTPNPFQFFLDHAKVALWKGEDFGKGGEGHVRINFGCPRKILEDALTRMYAAIEKAS